MGNIAIFVIVSDDKWYGQIMRMTKREAYKLMGVVVQEIMFCPLYEEFLGNVNHSNEDIEFWEKVRQYIIRSINERNAKV